MDTGSEAASWDGFGDKVLFGFTIKVGADKGIDEVMLVFVQAERDYRVRVGDVTDLEVGGSPIWEVITFSYTEEHSSCLLNCGGMEDLQRGGTVDEFF